MFFSLLHLAVQALFGLLVRCRRSSDVKDVELLVLRHKLEVWRRQGERPKFRRADLALLAAAACHWLRQPRRGEHGLRVGRLRTPRRRRPSAQDERASREPVDVWLDALRYPDGGD
jgi:hypothetical protein